MSYLDAVTNIVNIGLAWSLCPLVHITSSIPHGAVTGALQSSTVSPSLYPCRDISQGRVRKNKD